MKKLISVERKRDKTSLQVRQTLDLPKVVLLHGGPGLPDYLLTLSRRLEKQGIAHIRYSQRGTPPSPSSGPFTVDAHVEDLEAVRLNLGVDRFLLIGHSWGGGLSLFYTLKYPRHVKALVLITPMGLDPDWEPKFWSNLLSRLDLHSQAQIMELSRQSNSKGADVDQIALDQYRLLWPAFFYRPVPRFRLNQIGGRAHFETLKDVRKKLNDPTLVKKFKSIHQPALVIQTDHDPVPGESVQRIADALPESILLQIPDSGHFPWLENPEAFYSGLLPFLKKMLK